MMVEYPKLRRLVTRLVIFVVLLFGLSFACVIVDGLKVFSDDFAEHVHGGLFMVACLWLTGTFD